MVQEKFQKNTKTMETGEMQLWKEALANAVYHRGYDIREPIEVRVEKDMIEIVSFPGADRSVTGDILKELHLAEGRNTGLGKILRALEANVN